MYGLAQRRNRNRLKNKTDWRKRVGVEPTILAAWDRINGFEGHEDHRTPFASVIDNAIKMSSLLDVNNWRLFHRCLWCRLWCRLSRDSGHRIMQVRDRQMGVSACHR